jgi:hypothetical protein
MTIDLDRQIEYAERLYQTAKREAETSQIAKYEARCRRQMEKDLRTIEAIIETLNSAR